MIWALFKKETTERVQPPMPNPRFKHDGKLFRYAPQSDITAYEVALILPTAVQSSTPINLYGYFDYHAENYKDFYNLFNIQKYIIDQNFTSINKKDLKPGIQNINFEIDVSYCKKNMII